MNDEPPPDSLERDNSETPRMGFASFRAVIPIEVTL
jgi:hypothetical protein